jgi:hypothetical protein
VRLDGAFTINDTFMKSVTQTLPLFQTIGLRGLIAVWASPSSPRNPGLHLPPEPTRRQADPPRSLADIAATIFFLEALLHAARQPLRHPAGAAAPHHPRRGVGLATGSAGGG